MQCSVQDCVFFANEGCYGTCSRHSIYKPVKILSFMKPVLPKVILDFIFEMSHNPSPLYLRDNEIVAILGKRPEDVFVDPDLVQERVYWLEHHDLPYMGCDAIEYAIGVLDFTEGKYLRVEDAERIMVAIDLRDPNRYPRIAMEKAVVIKTLHRGILPRSMFSVGLCYHGAPACTNKMSRECVRNIVNGCGGGGGGGGGVP
jgi:hypothetical protein